MGLKYFLIKFVWHTEIILKSFYIFLKKSLLRKTLSTGVQESFRVKSGNHGAPFIPHGA